MNQDPQISVLIVCAGNICRSPAIEAALRKLVEDRGLSNKIFIDSCGVNGFFLGRDADPRMCAVAKEFGVVIDHKAHLFENVFFTVFDYILAVDRDVLAILKTLTQVPEEREKIHLVTEFSNHYHDQDIPDPYFGNDNSFHHTMEMVMDIAESLLAYLEKKIL